MFKKGLKWIKKSTEKEDAVEKTKNFDGYQVYFWNRETGTVKRIDTFATRELALASAKYLASFYKNLVVMDPSGDIVEML